MGAASKAPIITSAPIAAPIATSAAPAASTTPIPDRPVDRAGGGTSGCAANCEPTYFSAYEPGWASGESGDGT